MPLFHIALGMALFFMYVVCVLLKSVLERTASEKFP